MRNKTVFMVERKDKFGRSEYLDSGMGSRFKPNGKIFSMRTLMLKLGYFKQSSRGSKNLVYNVKSIEGADVVEYELVEINRKPVKDFIYEKKAVDVSFA